MVTQCVFRNAVNAIFKYYLYEHHVSKDCEVSKCSRALGIITNLKLWGYRFNLPKPSDLYLYHVI